MIYKVRNNNRSDQHTRKTHKKVEGDKEESLIKIRHPKPTNKPKQQVSARVQYE